MNDPWDWSKNQQQQVMMPAPASNVIAPLGAGSQEPTPATPPPAQQDPVSGALGKMATDKIAGEGGNILKNTFAKGAEAFTAANAPLAATGEAVAGGLLGSTLPAGAGAGGAAATAAGSTAAGLGTSLGAGASAAGSALAGGLAAAAPVALPVLALYGVSKMLKGK
jgi:hypothetical protein